ALWEVAGPRDRPPGHGAAVLDRAIARSEAVARMQAKSPYNIQFRIGIHTGPAVAGVIGVKKFIYDVWGDTVNTASRMESHGIPGRVQVTQAVYERLHEQYRFEPRGVIDVRGKGPMERYFLQGKIGTLGASPAAAAAEVAGAAEATP